MTTRARAPSSTGRDGGKERVVETVCTLDCPDACSLAVTVRDDRIVKVDASPVTAFTADDLAGGACSNDACVEVESPKIEALSPGGSASLCGRSRTGRGRCAPSRRRPR